LTELVDVARERFESQWTSEAQARRVLRVLGSFARYSSATERVRDPDAVSPELAKAFIEARSAGGAKPTIAERHFRRTSLRLLFRVGRQVGAASSDPTLDIALPARSPISTRPLTDEEIVLSRGCASWSLADTRRAAAWALAEATARTVEIAQIRVADMRVDEARVWIHGGNVTAPRWGELSTWAQEQLAQRLAALDNDPNARVAYAGRKAPDVGQISACVAIHDVLTRAGFAREANVRPASVAAWAGGRILEESRRIEEVARRLGMRSLDRTSRFIGFDWSAAD
jgi:integrase/recombinase XerC